MCHSYFFKSVMSDSKPSLILLPGWLASPCQPSLGLAPSAICGLLGPPTVGLWFIPSLRRPPLLLP